MSRYSGQQEGSTKFQKLSGAVITSRAGQFGKQQLVMAFQRIDGTSKIRTKQVEIKNLSKCFIPI